MAKGFAGWLFGLLSDDPKPKKQSAPDLREYYKDPNTIEFRCPGVYYHMAAVMALAKQMKVWDAPVSEIISSGKAGTKVFRYFFKKTPARLVKEENSPIDPNAVCVEVDGEKVGYAPADLAPELRRLIDLGRVQKISVFIGGGPYKVVSLNGDVYVDDDNHVQVKVTVFLEE